MSESQLVEAEDLVMRLTKPVTLVEEAGTRGYRWVPWAQARQLYRELVRMGASERWADLPVIDTRLRGTNFWKAVSRAKLMVLEKMDSCILGLHYSLDDLWTPKHIVYPWGEFLKRIADWHGLPLSTSPLRRETALSEKVIQWVKMHKVPGSPRFLVS